MKRDEIISEFEPIEPNCFETEREEEWYKTGLYHGATADVWNKVSSDCTDIPDGEDLLVKLTDGSIRIYDNRFPKSVITHYMKIPKITT